MSCLFHFECLLRELAPGVLAVLVVGVAVGVLANELNGDNRVSYFGFQKEEVIESRLKDAMRSMRTATDALPAAKPLDVSFFFAECQECKTAREKVLPEIRRVFGDRILIHEYDCSVLENYKLLLDCEKRFGSKRNVMLKMFIGDGYYLEGADKMASQALPLIGKALAAERGVDGGK